MVVEGLEMGGDRERMEGQGGVGQGMVGRSNT